MVQQAIRPRLEISASFCRHNDLIGLGIKFRQYRYTIGYVEYPAALYQLALTGFATLLVDSLN
jgi:hypothetical protein